MLNNILININGRQRYELPIDSHPQYNKQNAGGLHFWDRNETRYGPSAMAAEPNMNI